MSDSSRWAIVVTLVCSFLCLAVLLLPDVTTGPARDAVIIEDRSQEVVGASTVAMDHYDRGTPMVTAVSQDYCRLVDSDETPIAGAEITISGYHLRHTERIATTTTNSDGVFNYPPGTPERKRFYLDIAATGFLPARWIGNWDVYQVRNGVRRPDLLILRRPVSVSGRVVDETGRPIANAQVMVGSSSDNRTRANEVSVATDSQGMFAVEGINPGCVSIVCEAVDTRDLQSDSSESSDGGVLGLVVTHLCADDGATISDVVLNFEDSVCTLQGDVVGYGGHAVARARVEARLSGNQLCRRQSVFARTDVDGRFQFDGLPPGDYVVGAAGSRSATTVTLAKHEPTMIRLFNYVPGRKPTPSAAVTPEWGHANEGGIEAGILVDSDRRKHAVEQVIEVALLLRNTGNETRLVEMRVSKDCELQVVDATGHVTERLSQATLSGWPIAVTFLLAPGQVAEAGRFSIELLDAKHKNHDTPGVKAQFDLWCTRGESLSLQFNLNAALSDMTKRNIGGTGIDLTSGVLALPIAE